MQPSKNVYVIQSEAQSVPLADAMGLSSELCTVCVARVCVRHLLGDINRDGLSHCCQTWRDKKDKA